MFMSLKEITLEPTEKKALKNKQFIIYFKNLQIYIRKMYILNITTYRGEF